MSKVRNGVSHTVESKAFPDSERRLSLDLAVIAKKRQHQKFASERELNAAEAEQVRKGVRPSGRETSVVVLENEYDLKLGSSVAMERRLLQATADFKSRYRATDRHQRKRLPIRKDKGLRTYLKSETLVSWGKLVSPTRCETLCRKFRKRMRSCKLPALQKRGSRKSLLQVNALWVERAAQKKIEELMRRLEEDLSARIWSFAKRRHTENAVAVIEKLTEQVKQVSARVTVLKDKVMHGEETVPDLNFKLKAADKRAEDVVYERDGLQVRLQKSQCVQDKVCENITCI